MNWLLLRGLAREQRHWHEFPELLARRSGASVQRVDLAGAGTEARRLPWPSVAWMARDVARRWPPLESGGAPWSLVGLSLGGMVALELCRLYPRRFAGAVVVNSSSRLTPMVSRLRPEAALALGRAALMQDAVEREARVLELSSMLEPLERVRRAQLAAEFLRDAPATRRTLVSQLLAAARFLPPAPARVQTRLLFVTSRNDALVSPRCSHDLGELYGARVEEHPSAGHDLPLDAPDWLCERLLGFARELRSS